MDFTRRFYDSRGLYRFLFVQQINTGTLTLLDYKCFVDSYLKHREDIVIERDMKGVKKVRKILYDIHTEEKKSRTTSRNDNEVTNDASRDIVEPRPIHYQSCGGIAVAATNTIRFCWYL